MVLVPLNEAKIFSGLIMSLSSSSNERICLCLFKIAATFGSPGLKSQTKGKTLSIVVSKFLSGLRRLSLPLDSSFSKASCIKPMLYPLAVRCSIYSFLLSSYSWGSEAILVSLWPVL